MDNQQENVRVTHKPPYIYVRFLWKIALLPILSSTIVYYLFNGLGFSPANSYGEWFCKVTIPLMVAHLIEIYWFDKKRRQN